MTSIKYRLDPTAPGRALYRWLSIRPSWWDLRYIYEDVADLMRLLDVMSKDPGASPILTDMCGMRADGTDVSICIAVRESLTDVAIEAERVIVAARVELLVNDLERRFRHHMERAATASERHHVFEHAVRFEPPAAPPHYPNLVADLTLAITDQPIAPGGA